MTVDEIKELIKVVNESGIAELEVHRGNDRVRIQRTYPPVASDSAPPAVYTVPTALPVVAGSAPVAAPPPPLAMQPSVPATPPTHVTPEEDLVLVKSPIVGTFYESASPGSSPFVRIGDHVSPGQVLCIIESMKLMNEIEAEVSGIIMKKLVENGKPVEYGEALFAVKPS